MGRKLRKYLPQHRCAMSSKIKLLRFVLLIEALLFLAALATPAGYKARPWSPRPIESYPAKLVSEGVTIAADPLFTDALAAQVFDKSDVVARGIMPLAIVIFNSNDFPVDVEGKSIELLQQEDRIHGVDPLFAVQCIYASKPASRVPIPSPIPLPKITIMKSHAEACQDFKAKDFTLLKRVEPHATAGGFLFIQVRNAASLRKTLSESKVYIPNIYRGDNGKGLLYFEIELKPAIDAVPPK
jgi:hypothetical protein